jgi:hypothetical protein
MECWSVGVLECWSVGVLVEVVALRFNDRFDLLFGGFERLLNFPGG